MDVTQEPVRGGYWDRAIFSLPGIEIVQALQRGHTPTPPLAHLTGLGMTQSSAGMVTLMLPLSPWLIGLSGQVEPSIAAVPAMFAAVLTTIPPGTEVVPLMHSMNYVRPAMRSSDALFARARVLHTRRTLAIAEAVVEDSKGGLVAHATGQFRTRLMDRLPPPLRAPLGPFAEPVYPTPDPYLRPLPPGALYDPRIFVTHGGKRAMEMLREDGAPLIPAGLLYGMEFPDVSEGRATLRVPTSEWFCRGLRIVDEGALALFASAAAMTADATLLPAGRAIAALHIDVKFIRRVVPDGRELITRAQVVHFEDDILVTTFEMFDADGQRVAIGGKSAMFIEPRGIERATAPERILATVLFTDIVASTERATALGDAAWGALLDEHQRLVRQELANFKGREVKFTGDGVLATFDSPARAVQCARAIRDDVGRLGVEIYAGIHTGECEVRGSDIGGIAVNTAARVMGEAAPGEIVVTGTVRDLSAGSGLRFRDRGTRALKGIADEVRLYSVDV